jgi:hypothetical protein
MIQTACAVNNIFFSGSIKPQKEKTMAENQNLGPGEATCWSCGTVVKKGIKTCPKCGVASPAVSLATQQKAGKIALYVGLPVGIISLIVGLIIFLKGMSDGWMSFLLYDSNAFILAVLLLTVGLPCVIACPLFNLAIKKRASQVNHM